MGPSLVELETLIAKPKVAANWTGFYPRANQANFLIGVAQLYDLGGISLPGVTVEIEVKPPIVANEPLILFSLRQKFGAIRFRMYQLEVCSKAKRSHNGDPIIYGPHEHLLESEVRAVSESGVDYHDWSGSLEWFLRRVNVEDFKVARPW